LDAAQLKKIPHLANLTTDHLHKVGAIAAQKQLKANERVFQEGEVGTEMYIIASGKVRISKMVPGVGEEALAILEPGSYFGEMALIDDTPRSADATAHMPCTLYVIQKADLEELMFLHKDLAYELLCTFVRTLSGRLLSRGLPALRRASAGELLLEPGMSSALAVRLLAALELGRRVALAPASGRPRLLRAQDVASVLWSRLAHLPHEEFWAVLMNA